MNNIGHSQTTDTCINKTTETDFNSTLLDDGTLFSINTVNILNDFEDKAKIITKLMITIISLMILLATQIYTKITNTDNL